MATRTIECCGNCRGSVLAQLRGISALAPVAVTVSFPPAFPCWRSLRSVSAISRMGRISSGTSSSSSSYSVVVSAAADTVTEIDGLKVHPPSLSL